MTELSVFQTSPDVHNYAYDGSHSITVTNAEIPDVVKKVNGYSEIPLIEINGAFTDAQNLSYHVLMSYEEMCDSPAKIPFCVDSMLHDENPYFLTFEISRKATPEKIIELFSCGSLHSSHVIEFALHNRNQLEALRLAIVDKSQSSQDDTFAELENILESEAFCNSVSIHETADEIKSKRRINSIEVNFDNIHTIAELETFAAFHKMGGHEFEALHLAYVHSKTSTIQSDYVEGNISITELERRLKNQQNNGTIDMTEGTLHDIVQKNLRLREVKNALELPIRTIVKDILLSATNTRHNHFFSSTLARLDSIRSRQRQPIVQRLIQKTKSALFTRTPQNSNIELSEFILGLNDSDFRVLVHSIFWDSIGLGYDFSNYDEDVRLGTNEYRIKFDADRGEQRRLLFSNSGVFLEERLDLTGKGYSNYDSLNFSDKFDTVNIRKTDMIDSVIVRKRIRHNFRNVIEDVRKGNLRLTSHTAQERTIRLGVIDDSDPIEKKLQPDITINLCEDRRGVYFSKSPNTVNILLRTQQDIDELLQKYPLFLDGKYSFGSLVVHRSPSRRRGEMQLYFTKGMKRENVHFVTESTFKATH